MRLRTANNHRAKHLRRAAFAYSKATWQRMVERAARSGNYRKVRNSGFARRNRKVVGAL